MKTFDKSYKLLEEMYADGYFPDFLVDKVRDEVQKIIKLLETGETDEGVIQENLDGMVCAINDLQEEFYENDSELETAARESIGETIDYVLKWFAVPINLDEALRECEW